MMTVFHCYGVLVGHRNMTVRRLRAKTGALLSHTFVPDDSSKDT
jgi:hypothetical protein